MKRAMDVLGKALRLESKIAGQLDKAAKGFVRSGAREPWKSCMRFSTGLNGNTVERRGSACSIQQIELSVLAPSPEARARLEAVFSGDPSLNARVMERLQSGGCSTAGIALAITYATRAQKTWGDREFDLNFARVTPPDVKEPAPGSQHDRIEVTVLRGVAERRTYSLPARRIDFGRYAEVRDSRNRLIRTNHVAFTEGAGDVNQTVSRQHAHVSYEPGSGDFRLHDDGGGHGTGIVRDGRTVPVPRGSRGVRLRSGDELVLGEARVRVRFPPDTTR